MSLIVLALLLPAVLSHFESGYLFVEQQGPTGEAYRVVRDQSHPAGIGWLFCHSGYSFLLRSSRLEVGSLTTTLVSRCRHR
jgi:hypothetical protein